MKNIYLTVNLCLIIPLGFSKWSIAFGNLTLVTVKRQLSIMILGLVKRPVTYNKLLPE